jgi:tRNA-modifying protein YgfZ
MILAVSLDAYEAARRRVASIDRSSSRGRIVLSGVDRRSFLQGLLTNDIAALAPGQGCYSAYLTPQGRMITDLHVYELGDMILLTMEGDVKDTLMAKLDQMIFSEDVQLGDVTATFAQIALLGPQAAPVLSSLLADVPPERLAGLPTDGNARASYRGEPVIVTRIVDAGEAGYDVFVDRDKASSFVSVLTDAGVVPVDKATAEAIRIEGGIPRFHQDMDEGTIPLEAGIESRAISFTKGCYVGQEVVIRVLHRGHGRVVRKLVGLTFSNSETPPAGAPVQGADREIGHVTSSAFSPALQRPIAFAYVHRDFIAPGTVVSVNGANAEVTQLPFVG